MLGVACGAPNCDSPSQWVVSIGSTGAQQWRREYCGNLSHRSVPALFRPRPGHGPIQQRLC